MTTLHQFATGPVRVGLLAGVPRDADNAAYALSESGYAVRRVRGTRMPTVPAVYDEFAAALQFPYYFGANKDAFDECLRDWQDWLGAAPDLIVIVRDAGALLGDQPGEVPWLLSALQDAGIRVVAQVAALDSAALARRWTTAGVAIVRLDD
ncbi:barstar family protein [Rhodococcus sp. NPDC003322]